MDTNTTIGELRTSVAQFTSARNWEIFHTPKNLSMAIAIEAAELMEHFQWRNPQESEILLYEQNHRDEIADELADIVIYCLSFSNHCGIDLSESIRKKMERNEVRFPVSSPNSF